MNNFGWFQYVVLIIIASVWIWVLGRPLVAGLLNRAGRDPVGQWQRSVGGAAVASRPRSFGTPGRSQAQHRRLQIFMALCIAAVVSLVLAVIFRGVWVYEHLLMDALLVGYTVLAARAGAAEAERRSKVSYLSPARASANPVYIRAVNDA